MDNTELIYGIAHAKDEKYAIATALSYWVFSCRNIDRSPAQGVDTWTYLEKSIENSAFSAETLESYVQTLSNKLVSDLRPEKLNGISGFLSIEAIRQSLEFEDFEILDLLSKEPSIIQVTCRLNHLIIKEKIEV